MKVQSILPHIWSVSKATDVKLKTCKLAPLRRKPTLIQPDPLLKSIHMNQLIKSQIHPYHILCIRVSIGSTPIMHVIRYQITDVKLKTVKLLASLSFVILLNITRQPFRYIVGAIVTASYNILYSLVSYTTSKYEVKLLKGRSPWVSLINLTEPS